MNPTITQHPASSIQQLAALCLCASVAFLTACRSTSVRYAPEPFTPAPAGTNGNRSVRVAPVPASPAPALAATTGDVMTVQVLERDVVDGKPCWRLNFTALPGYYQIQGSVDLVTWWNESPVLPQPVPARAWPLPDNGQCRFFRIVEVAP